MKRIFFVGCLTINLGVQFADAADAEYVARGIVLTPPLVRATNFINLGQFGPFATVQPYETGYTLNFTNFGIMSASPGFRIEYVDPLTSFRSLASTFVNRNPGLVEVTDPAPDAFLPCLRALVGSSRLHISATNIITGAGLPLLGRSLAAGANGEIRLVGDNVDLSFSGVGITPVWATVYGSDRGTADNPVFTPDIAMYDTASAQVEFIPNQYGLNTAGLWNGTQATAPGVTLMPNTTPGFSLASPTADSYTNWVNLYTVSVTNVTGNYDNVQPSNIVVTTVGLASNVFKGAVFAAAPPQFSVQVGFSASPQGQPANYFNTHSLLIQTLLTNTMVEGNDIVSFWIEDILGSDSRRRGTVQNTVGCESVTTKPANYIVDRTATTPGAQGNLGYPNATFFTSAGLILLHTNQISPDAVTNTFIDVGSTAGYGVFADNIVTRPPTSATGVGIEGSNETNYTGRVRVYANNLNLEQTRIRGEGLITIEANHLVSTKSTVIDAEQINLALSSTNGLLTLDNLVPPAVVRLRGEIVLWSAVWTNTAIIVLTNNFNLTNQAVFDPPGSTNIIGTNLVALPEPITNFCQVGYFVTMVDARALQSVLPVQTFSVETKARETVFDDDMTVYRKLKIGGRSLTLNSALTIPGGYPADPLTGTIPLDPPVESWDVNVAPELLYLTNRFRLAVANAIHLGDDRSTPYAAVVNEGEMTASLISINSSYLQNNGSINSLGDLEFLGGVAKFENGTNTAGTITRLNVATAKFNGLNLFSGGTLFLNVTDSLSDAESNLPNDLFLNDGFHMAIRPKSGSLLRTTIYSLDGVVPAQSIDHVWAGTDYGPNAAGFEDNVAVGTLVLDALSPNSRFNFAGAGSQNALYVDVLDLQALANITNQLRIASNFRLYYGSVLLNFVPPLNNQGIQPTPEEYLDGAFGGRLRWVRTYAGADSSIPVLITNLPSGPVTIYVNQALAESRIIDSDGDGVPNYNDGVPPNGDKFAVGFLTVTTSGNGTVAPNLTGQYLIVGETYSMRAVPNDGSDFTGWTGSIESATPLLTFLVEGDMVLNANFAYAPSSATYRGLFHEQDMVQMGRSGSVTISTTTSGSCSGSLVIGRNKHSFKGTLSDEGKAVFTIPRSGNTTLTLELQVGDAYATGTLTDGDWTAVLTAGRAVFNASSNPAPRTGKYTIIFPGNGNAAETNTPHGDGYGSVNLATSGKVKLSGALGDNTKISQSSTLTPDLQWPLYLSLYSGKGQLLGWLTFSESGIEDLGGDVSWIKNPDLAAKFYPGGFNVELDATGAKFDPLLFPLTGFSEGLASFTGGNSLGFANAFQVVEKNKVINLGPGKMSLKLNTSSGLFSGSAVDPNTGKSIKFKGALHQKLEEGRGVFPGTTQTGSVWIRE